MPKSFCEKISTVGGLGCDERKGRGYKMIDGGKTDSLQEECGLSVFYWKILISQGHTFRSRKNIYFSKRLKIF